MSKRTVQRQVRRNVLDAINLQEAELRDSSHHDSSSHSDAVYSDSNLDTFSQVSGDVSDDSYNEDTEKLSLDDELLLIFTIHNASRNLMESILSLLSRHGMPVSKTVYMLKRRQGKNLSAVRSLEDGEFSYIGIRDNLNFCMENGFLKKATDDTNSIRVEATINIDGLPLYNSSSLNAWPILMKIDCVPRALPVALYCGLKKPDLQTYLEELIDELMCLTTSGMVIREHAIWFTKVLFVCDAPARAYICNLRSHNAKVGCNYCRVFCQVENKRVVYPCSVQDPRTDLAYARIQESNQKHDPSPLLSIPGFGMYSSVPPDYQHAVCLGVTRKLFYLYFSSDFGSRSKLSNQQITDLSDMIVFYAKYTPSEFQRRPRRVDTELKHFKATEFRLFLLYVGPFFFKNFLNDELYKHFLLLHFSIYVLSSSNHEALYPNAQRCIEIFVYDMKRIFSNRAMTYNVHVLLHLHDFVLKHGNLNKFSTFGFENHLHHIKKRIRVTRHIFRHVLNQCFTLRNICISDCVSDLFFSSKSPNNCAIVNGCIIKVDKTESDSVSGYELVFRDELYSFPYSSRFLGIGYYNLSRSFVIGRPTGKCFMIPVDSAYLVIPFV